MNQNSHQAAPTQFVEANGIRFAYRRFGKAGGVPIVFNQHYTGTMDYWDPAVTNGLAGDREVILFNNAGVSSSFGEVPTTFEQMGANAVAFSRALGLNNKQPIQGRNSNAMYCSSSCCQHWPQSQAKPKITSLPDTRGTPEHGLQTGASGRAATMKSYARESAIVIREIAKQFPDWKDQALHLAQM
jgi:hypothetical protein